MHRMARSPRSSSRPSTALQQRPDTLLGMRILTPATPAALPAASGRPPEQPAGGLRGFAVRHPLVVLILIFNVFGQAAVLVPTIVMGARAPDLGVLQSGALIVFLLLPALVLVRLSRGPDAVRRLLRDVVAYRVNPLWYLLPLVVVPAGVLLANLFLPRSAPLTLSAVVTAYVAGFLPGLVVQFVSTNWWEETVWTGVVQSPLQQRFGPLRGLLLTTPLFALEHVFLTLGKSLVEALTVMALLTVSIFFVRAGFGWIYRRTGSLALVGLIHASSNAAVLGLAGRLFDGPADGVLALAVFGLVALVLTRGRLGWPKPTSLAEQPDSLDVSR